MNRKNQFNKTQQAVMRYVFGSNDCNSDRSYGISSRAQHMPVLEGSREWLVGQDLKAIGLVDIVQNVSTKIWYIVQVKQLS